MAGCGGEAGRWFGECGRAVRLSKVGGSAAGSVDGWGVRGGGEGGEVRGVGGRRRDGGFRVD